MKSFLLKASIFLFLSKISYGDVLFSSLPQSLSVIASPMNGQVLKAGEDNIILTFGLNQSTATNQPNDSYKKIKVKLCYAPISQVDRKWRKTVNNLKKDKTCQFTMYDNSYETNVTGFKWEIEKDTPTATYFVRAYAYNSIDEEIAYGQTTNDKKTENLFEIEGISGRHASLDIASISFSVFALVSLFGFFLIEKRQSKS